MQSDPTQVVRPLLDYSRPPRLAWVNRWKRWLILLAGGMAVALVGYRYEPQVQRHFEWLYWSYRCAEYKTSGEIERVVYEPSQAKKLVANNPDYFSNGGAALYRPYVYRKLEQPDGRCNWIGDDDISAWNCIAFVGSRTRSDGISRLVVIAGPMDHALDVLAMTHVLVLPTPGLFDSIPKPVGGLDSYSGRWEPIDVRAEIADPNDPSHITFDYVYGWTANAPPVVGKIDAYLKNDDSIEFKAPLYLRRTKISGVIPMEFVDGIFALSH